MSNCVIKWRKINKEGKMKKVFFATTMLAFVVGMMAIILLVRNHRAGKEPAPVIAKILVASEGLFAVCFLAALVAS